MMNDKNNERIQELAVELCKKYHEAKTADVTDEMLLSNGELRDLRNELIELIMALYKKREDDSSAWYKICFYVIRSIPRFEYGVSEREYCEFTHYFGSIYKNDFQNIDEEESDSYIRSDVGGNSEDMRYVKRLLKYCSTQSINIRDISDEDFEALRVAFCKRMSVRRLRQLVSIAVSFTEVGSLSCGEGVDYSERIGREDPYFSEERFDDIKTLVDAIPRFSKYYLRNNQIQIVRCLYTNRLAMYFRKYAETDHGDEYEKTTSEQEKKAIRTRFLMDEFKEYEEDLYEFVLYLGYLSYVLEEPVPDTIFQICMNEYRTDNQSVRHFTDETAERYCGMSKGNVKKTYGPKLNEINCRIIEFYQNN